MTTPGETFYQPRTEAERQADTNVPVLDARLSDSLAALRNFVDSPKPSTTAAQASAAYDASKLLCRLMVALVRHRLRRYEGTE